MVPKNINLETLMVPIYYVVECLTKPETFGKYSLKLIPWK